MDSSGNYNVFVPSVQLNSRVRAGLAALRLVCLSQSKFLIPVRDSGRPSPPHCVRKNLILTPAFMS